MLRGLTIVCMIVVNNGAGPHSFDQLQHSDWNGLTVCDLVFPFFLFIMGVTTYLSQSKTGFRCDGHSIAKVIRRTVIILLICWLLHWFDNVCSGKSWLDFDRLRLTGVLTRIALCYCAVSLLSMWLSLRAMIVTTVLLLVVYGALLLGFDGYTNGPENVNSIVDRALLSEGHLYTKRPVDPEGLLATISAVAHTIIGFCCGAIIKRRESLDKKLVDLFVTGTLLMLAGLCLTGLFPLNKRIWSPSYVLLTCGMAETLLALFAWMIDGKGWRSRFTVFEAYGVNPLFLYVLGEVLGTIAGATGLKEAAYRAIASVISSPELASLTYSLLFVAVVTLFAIPLYKKKIYIKI